MFTVMFTVIWNLLILRICQSSVCKDLDVFDTTSSMIKAWTLKCRRRARWRPLPLNLHGKNVASGRQSAFRRPSAPQPPRKKCRQRAFRGPSAPQPPRKKMSPELVLETLVLLFA